MFSAKLIERGLGLFVLFFFFKESRLGVYPYLYTRVCVDMETELWLVCCFGALLSSHGGDTDGGGKVSAFRFPSCLWGRGRAAERGE